MQITQTTLKRLGTFFALEVLPIILFFGAFKMSGFITAVITLAIATTLSLAASILIYRRIPYFTLIVGGTTVLASLATVLADNPRILITRDTLHYSTFGIILLILAHYDTLVLKKMCESIFGITDHAWRILQKRWGTALIIAGSLNAIIGFTLPTELWVTYKAGLLAAFTIFGTYQFTLTKKHRKQKTNTWGVWS